MIEKGAKSNELIDNNNNNKKKREETVVALHQNSRSQLTFVTEANRFLIRATLQHIIFPAKQVLGSYYSEFFFV